MKLTGMVVDGIEIVGFQIQNSAGRSLVVKYSQMLDIASKGKVDGISVKNIGGSDTLIGIDYSTLLRIPLTGISGEVLEQLENGKYKVELDGETKELSPKEVWKYSVSGVLENISAGIHKEGTTYRKCLGSIVPVEA